MLAENGYRVIQQPRVQPGKKGVKTKSEGDLVKTEADVLVEGNVFDIKTPQGSEVSSFAKNQIKNKLYQADRFVINLKHSTFSADDLLKQLDDHPVSGLKEILFVEKNGTIRRVVF
jgi:hypothetical protein